MNFIIRLKHPFIHGEIKHFHGETLRFVGMNHTLNQEAAIELWRMCIAAATQP